MRRKLAKGWPAAILAGMLTIAAVSSSLAQTKPAASPAMSMPKVGEMAPDFALKYFDGNDLKDVSLSQYRGKKNVVVAFFIFAFTGG